MTSYVTGRRKHTRYYKTSYVTGRRKEGISDATEPKQTNNAAKARGSSLTRGVFIMMSGFSNSQTHGKISWHQSFSK
jgi:hypothetical protein